MLQQFVIGSSIPVLLYFFLKVPTIPKTIRNYSFLEYSIIAPIFLGLMNVISKQIQDKYSMTNNMRFKVIGLISPLIVFTYALLTKVYNFNDKEWLSYLFRIILTHFLIFNIIVKYIENNIFKEKFEKKNMIKKLIRQSSRYSSAARGDKNNLISILHSNYGAAYLFSLKDLFSEKEIEEVLGSEEKRKKYESKIIEVQDESTRKAVKDCPQYAGITDFLTELAAES